MAMLLMLRHGGVKSVSLQWLVVAQAELMLRR